MSQIFDVSQDDVSKSGIPDLTLITGYPSLNNNGVYNGITYYALIDAISWGGGAATLNSGVPGTPQGKISAYLDSTYPWIQVPYSITEQLYKNLKGATYAKDTGLWHFDCTELTVKITIAGHDYPISPLTAVQRIESLNCVGTVSHTGTPAHSTLVYAYSGSSRPNRITLEAMLYSAFPSVSHSYVWCCFTGC